MINLIRRRLKGGVLEDGAVHPSDEGTPQGGSISELLSNLYIHVRGHYYGVAANIRAVQVYRAVERYWPGCCVGAVGPQVA